MGDGLLVSWCFHQCRELIRGANNRGTRAVVRIELEHPRPGEVLGELLHIFGGGATEAVNRLPGIPDDPRGIVRSAERAQQGRHGTTDVLILIDHNPCVLLPILRD